MKEPISTYPQQETDQQFMDAVLAGLNSVPKQLACKFFYDERGSKLFDRICELDEYYLTRTEAAIMNRFASEMAEQIGEGVMLVEYGSGSSDKTRLLLNHLRSPVAYIPVDISSDYLLDVAAALQLEFPSVEVLPVVADFTQAFDLPVPTESPTHAAVYFPGSTIGNFRPAEAERLLQQIAELCGCGGGLLLGIDLVKDVDVLELAYNDPQGVTAEFNLNLLHRLKHELDAELDLDSFEHYARYDDEHDRIEIFIRSLCDQVIVLGEETIQLEQGELIHTEYSHKYTIESFADLAQRAGLTLRRSWTDDQNLFAVLHLAVLD